MNINISIILLIFFNNIRYRVKKPYIIISDSPPLFVTSFKKTGFLVYVYAQLHTQHRSIAEFRLSSILCHKIIFVWPRTAMC